MTIIRAAADLLGPLRDSDSINPEYKRAIVELTAATLGVLTTETRDTVETLIDLAREQL